MQRYLFVSNLTQYKSRPNSRNPDVRTIEEDIIQAVYKAGAISEDMRDNLGKVTMTGLCKITNCHNNNRCSSSDVQGQTREYQQLDN